MDRSGKGAERVGEQKEEEDRGKKPGLEVKMQTSWSHGVKDDARNVNTTKSAAYSFN